MENWARLMWCYRWLWYLNRITYTSSIPLLYCLSSVISVLGKYSVMTLRAWENTGGYEIAVVVASSLVCSDQSNLWWWQKDGDVMTEVWGAISNRPTRINLHITISGIPSILVYSYTYILCDRNIVQCILAWWFLHLV